ncbi:MAG: hypothetical protein NZM11_07870 [Anaerolineales bacterium]|nr:hypothetical protein [Anaerolineales bacterium]
MNNLVDNAPWLLGLSVLAIIGFGILLVVGFNMLRREAQKDNPPTPSENKPAGLALPAALADRLALRAAAPADPNANEVLRVLRDRLTGRVLLEINGKRYTQLSEVTESEVRRALLLTLRDLQEFAGLSALTTSHTPAQFSANPPAPAHPAAPPPAPTEMPASPAVSAEVEAVLSQLNAAPLPKTNETHTPLRLPSMNIFKQMAQAREVSAREIAPIKSVAQQIDEVLQHLILGTPFAWQNLHVASDPNGNVVFEVGTDLYRSVEEIPDRNLQVVFQEAIRRWEQER